jgi:hypothetical protein
LGCHLVERRVVEHFAPAKHMHKEIRRRFRTDKLLVLIADLVVILRVRAVFSNELLAA